MGHLDPSEALQSFSKANINASDIPDDLTEMLVDGSVEQLPVENVEGGLKVEGSGVPELLGLGLDRRDDPEEPLEW